MLRFRVPALSGVLQRNFHNSLIKCKSTQANAIKDAKNATSSLYESASGTDDQIGVASSTGKLAAHLPLVKNFFVGVVDRELLPFPEPIPREEMTLLQNEVLPFKTFFNESVDAEQIAAKRSIPTDVVDNLRELGLYGINVPKRYDGNGWEWSQSLMATEYESQCTEVALSLLSHRVVIDMIKEACSEDQQRNFLGQLAKGKQVATEAVYEYEISEDDFFNTTAEYYAEKDCWLLDGEKAFVITGPLPTDAKQLFLVIAQTKRPNLTGDNARGTTVFLVDDTLPGIKLGDIHPTTGCPGVRMQRVHFKQVQLPESCVVGLPHEGNEAAEILLRASRLRSAMLSLGISKQLVQELAQYSVNSQQCGVVLQDYQITKMHLSRALCGVYASESMTYFTAGLLDEFDKPDVMLESAIAKYYTLKENYRLITQCIDVMGAKSLHAGHNIERHFRNVMQLYTQNESIDTLRFYIGLVGMQHAGVLLNDVIKKGRNPLFHPQHVFSKIFSGSNIDTPKTNMRLGEKLHPTLEGPALCIEHSVARLQMCVELLLTRYGNTIVERHGDLGRIADMATTIYAMFASNSRASRSYCIGLQYADYEILTATTICLGGRDYIKMLADEIFNGEYVNNDRNLLRLSKQVANSQGYFPVHPLTYNF